MNHLPLVVIDTSVFISAYLSRNLITAPNRILSHWREGDFVLIMTPQIFDELITVLSRKRINQELILDLAESIYGLALFSEGAYETNFLDDIDPNDNMFLSACYESQADYLVSLDKHLLNLKHFHQTLIFNPHSFLKQLSQS